MPRTSAPSPVPAYVATIAPLDLDSTPMRLVRLSRRQHRAIDGLTVPIALTSPSPLTPVVQAQLAIQDAVARILRDRGVSAVLWQGEDAGDLSVWHDGGFLPIASVTLTPAQSAVAA